MPMNRKGKGTTLSSLFLSLYHFLCCLLHFSVVSLFLFTCLLMSFFIICKEKKYRAHTCVDVHSTSFTGLFYFSPTYQILEIVYQLHKNILKCYCRCDTPSDRCNCAIITPGTQFPFSGSILNL